MSRLYLIRHGESVWNAARRLQGQADPDLSPRGEDQARELATALPPQLPRDAICSDLRRASRTAALLGLHAQPDRRWREIGVGEWAGQDTDDLRTRDPACWRAWRAGDFTPPGGESGEAFRDRLSDALDALSGDSLVVTHGGVIRAVTSIILDLPSDRLAPVPPASITILDRGQWPRLRGYGLTADLSRDTPD